MRFFTGHIFWPITHFVPHTTDGARRALSRLRTPDTPPSFRSMHCSVRASGGRLEGRLLSRDSGLFCQHGIVPKDDASRKQSSTCQKKFIDPARRTKHGLLSSKTTPLQKFITSVRTNTRWPARFITGG